MPVVRKNRALPCAVHRFDRFTANTPPPLGRAHRLSDCAPHHGLHHLFQNPLPHPQPFWTRRCPDELSIPGQPRRQRFCSESSWSVAHPVRSVCSHYHADVAFGSKLTLKNMGWGGGLLHSHVQTYPVGSNQQQVTCYHYKDTNNDWVITPRWEEPAVDLNGPIRFLMHGELLRLVHEPTGRNLHSHNIPAPITKLNNEVSCYGNATVGDQNDYWYVEVIDDIRRGSRENFERIHSLTTRLRFRHYISGCYLRAATKSLPEWGFKQIEVSCDKENNPEDPYTHWNVESHSNDRCASLFFCPFLGNGDVLTPNVRSPSLHSAPWRYQILPLGVLARLLAPKCRDDDLEQRARTRPRQR